MSIFVKTIQKHGDDRNAKHPCLSVLLAIADVGYPMHDIEGYQEPGDAIELARKTGIKLPKEGADDRFHAFGERWRAPLFDVCLSEPIGIEDNIITQIGDNKCVPILFESCCAHILFFRQVA